MTNSFGDPKGTIYVDDKGRPFSPEPERDDYPIGVEGWISWARAHSAWRDQITSAANRVFDEQFRKSLRKAS